MQKISQNKPDETEIIAEYLKKKGIIEDINDFKEEMEKYKEKENKKPETEVNRWVRVLTELVDWANEG